MKRLVICFVGLGFLSSCGGGDSTTGPPSPTVSIRLAIVDGDNQQATVVTALPQDLVVKVTDASANPQSGKTVSWSITGGDAALNPSSTSTNGEGLASSRLTLGTAAGAVTVRASVGGTTPVTFSATALAGPAEALRITPPFGVLSLSDTESLSVDLTDAYGNTVGDAAAQLESRDPSILAISGTTASGQALGVTRVIARAASLVDSATYAVVEPDGFALVLLTDEGDVFGTGTAGESITLRLKLVPPRGGGGAIASLQGAIRWNAARLRYLGSDAGEQGIRWTDNESEPGDVRFAGYTEQVMSGETNLAIYRYEFLAAGSPAELAIDLGVAGDGESDLMTYRILPVIAVLEVGP